MRGLALACWVALAHGCAVDHDTRIADAGDGVDAFRAVTDASRLDAFAPDAFALVPDASRADAFAPDAFGFVPDAFVPPSDAFGPPSDAGLTRAGYVIVEQGVLVGGVQQAPILEGFFGAGTPADLMRGSLLPGCAMLEQSGSCRVLTCTTGASTDLAGTVSASAGTFSLSTSTTTPSGGGPPTWDLYFAYASGAQIPAGQIVDLTATGATVPAFSAGVSMPAAIGATLPGTVARSTDYVVTWSASSADRVWVGIDSASANAGTPYIECQAPAALGSITISHTLIAAHFAAGDSVFAYAANTNTAYTSAGSYLIRLEAWSYAETNATAVAP